MILLKTPKVRSYFGLAQLQNVKQQANFGMCSTGKISFMDSFAIIRKLRNPKATV